MYNDTLKVANKIITDKDLEEIFNKMQEEIEQCEKQCKLEEAQNERYEREYQNWTVKDYSGNIKVNVNFYDDTSISFDNFQNFMGIFNSRLDEIKYFYLRYSASYARQEQGKPMDYINQSICLDVYETKMNIDVNLNSTDEIMNKIYDIIKEKILSAPEKYDRIIKKKSSIVNKVGFAIGAIPAIVILTLLALVPTIRQAYTLTYVVYPIGCLLLAFTLGTTFCVGGIERLYKNIVPDKKYAGYDKKNYKSIYKDDVESYIQTSEIIIGKNINNLEKRKKIEELEAKYSSFIPVELLIIGCISVVIIIIGNLF